MDRIGLVARAICKADNYSIKAMGDEICCQFAPASRRRPNGTNREPDVDEPMVCCADEYEEAAEAALEAIGLGLDDPDEVARQIRAIANDVPESAFQKELVTLDLCKRIATRLYRLADRVEHGNDPDQAKKKWCPHARVGLSVSDGDRIRRTLGGEPIGYCGLSGDDR